MSDGFLKNLSVPMLLASKIRLTVKNLLHQGFPDYRDAADSMENPAVDGVQTPHPGRVRTDTGMGK